MADLFDMERDLSPADVEINSTDDRSGIVASGQIDGVSAVNETLMDMFTDIIKRDSEINVNSVYMGTVQKVDGRLKAAFVDIDDGVGYLPFSNTTRMIREDEDIKVQVRSIPMGDKKPVLDMKINLPGRYAVLLSDNGAKVSKKIKGDRRQELLSLAKKLMPEDWGLLWRTSAQDAEEETLMEDVDELKTAAEEVEMSLSNPLYPGEEYIAFEFGGKARKQLDDMRSKVAHTAKKHHAYKSLGESYSLAVDIAEELMDKVDKDEVDAALRKTFYKNLDTYFYTLEHVKSNGHVTYLKGLVKDLEEDHLIIRRRMSPSRRYDSPDLEMDEGDYAITEVNEGDWYYINSYFSKNDKPKGQLVNINTPIEFYPGRVRCIDLEIDIAIRPSGKAEILRETSLIDLVSQGYIDKNLYEKALDIADEVVKGEIETVPAEDQ